MKLVTFTIKDIPTARSRIGALLGHSQVVDFTAELPFQDMLAFLQSGETGLRMAEKIVEGGKYRIALSTCVLKAPISNPEKLICVGMNYVEHCTEQSVPIPKEPLIFSKFASTITNPNDPIRFDSTLTQKMDWEVEMCVVIGKEVPRNIDASDAMPYVVGYTVAHDVSARDWQLERNGGQWLLGKSMDTFSPLGPCITTVDEMGDKIKCAGVRCVVNGHIVQNSDLSELVFDPPKLISWISKFMTLKPGDLIFTGTPSGVGAFRNPPVWLKHGDVVTVEIDGLGSVTNTCVDVSAAKL